MTGLIYLGLQVEPLGRRLWMYTMLCSWDRLATRTEAFYASVATTSRGLVTFCRARAGAKSRARDFLSLARGSGPALEGWKVELEGVANPTSSVFREPERPLPMLRPPRRKRNSRPKAASAARAWQRGPARRTRHYAARGYPFPKGTGSDAYPLWLRARSPTAPCPGHPRRQRTATASPPSPRRSRTYAPAWR